jgi:hypothetical protein
MNNPLQRLAAGLTTGVTRVALLAVGAVAALAALLLGVALATGLMGWALLRGRRPLVRQAFVWPGRAARVPPQAAAEVVDIEAREVPEPAPRPLPKG